MLRESGANYFLDSEFPILIADYRFLDIFLSREQGWG